MHKISADILQNKDDMSTNIQVRMLTAQIRISILQQQEVNRLSPGDQKHCVYEFLPYTKHNANPLQRKTD
jgi:hypothetical protein